MQPKPRQITHDELMQLPIVRFDGPIRLVHTKAELEAAGQAIRHERLVGFDTETRPTFRKGQSHLPSLVQIAGAKCVYLFQLAKVDCSGVIAEILGNEHTVKAGIAVYRDLLDLTKLFPFIANNVIDLSAVAKKSGYEQTGMRNLAGIFLGYRITKGAQTSNWAAAHLTETQLRYAATDAWACRELYRRFEALGLLPES
jgi:ribonuclease D